LTSVLVLQDAQSYSAAQRIRAAYGRDHWIEELGLELVESAEVLAAWARSGRLVAFVGAGVSMTAGLPGWVELLEELGESVGLATTDREQLRDMDARDAVSLLERRLRRRGELLDQWLRRRFSTSNVPSLSHYLIASLADPRGGHDQLRHAVRGRVGICGGRTCGCAAPRPNRVSGPLVAEAAR